MKKLFFLLIVMFFFVPVTSAYAYLDPGTGSYIFQIIIAFLCGAAFTIKIYWGKIKLFFTKKKKQEGKQDENK